MICENCDGVKPAVKTVRRYDQRDLERWCLRIETAVVTVVSSSEDGGKAAEEQ